MNNQWFSKVAVWLVIALVLFTVFKQFDRGVAQGNQIGYGCGFFVEHGTTWH